MQQHAPGAAAQHVELSSSPAQHTGEGVSALKAMLNDRQVVSRTRTVRALRGNMLSFIGELAGHVYANPVKRHNPDCGTLAKPTGVSQMQPIHISWLAIFR